MSCDYSVCGDCTEKGCNCCRCQYHISAKTERLLLKISLLETDIAMHKQIEASMERIIKSLNEERQVPKKVKDEQI